MSYPTTIQKENFAIKKKDRSSNLELYRIIVMILIVAHHYVVNSGLLESLQSDSFNSASSFMILFGAWGKTGINCFVIITGYFLCKQKYTWEKLLKLYLQILFYTLIIYTIFCYTGHEKLSFLTVLWLFWPIKSISDNFTGCFLLFYLFIPFLNIFLQQLDQKKHMYLLILLVLGLSVLPSIPMIKMTFNYVEWFIVLYIIGAYIRSFGMFKRISHGMWGWISLVLVFVSSVSVLGMLVLYKYGHITKFYPYFFISDSNKFLALSVAVSSFMYFKDLKIPQSRLINILGGTTFGVLLIHANSDAMRTWLWRETVDCIGHYGQSVIWVCGYATISVLVIFIVCAGIDWFRGKYIEPHLMRFTKSAIMQIWNIRKKADSRIK